MCYISAMDKDTPNQPPKRPTLRLNISRKPPAAPETQPPPVAARPEPVAADKPGGGKAVAAKPAAGAGKGKDGKQPKKVTPPQPRLLEKAAKGLMRWMDGQSDVWRDKLPLKIGVLDEVYALLDREGMRDTWSNRVVRKAVQWHTGVAAYQEGILSCPHRYGLDGTVGGEVTEVQRGHAKAVLEKLAARKAAKLGGEKDRG